MTEPWKDGLLWGLVAFVLVAYLIQGYIVRISQNITTRYNFDGILRNPWVYSIVWLILSGFLAWIIYQSWFVSQLYFVLSMALVFLNILWIVSLYYFGMIEVAALILMIKLVIVLYLLIDGWNKLERVAWSLLVVYGVWIVIANYFNIRLYYNNRYA